MSEETYESESVLSPREEALLDDGHTTLALAAGLVAALVAGALWAVLVFITDMEIGYVAWGVGLLVGWAMTRVTICRTKQLALAAAAFAILGLAAGKAFIFASSAGAIAAELEQDEAVMASAVAWQMYDSRELDEATLTTLDAAREAGDTVSDAVWSAMTTQAASKLETMSPEKRQAVAREISEEIQSNLGILGGIWVQLSMFDALWLLLAVGTAYRMLAPANEEVLQEPEVPA